MSPWDELLDRLTHPLRVDPELRREISRELLGHLEDSHLEFTAGGMTDDQAQAAAAKALGEEAEISRQIWEANRDRVRLRRVVKWAAGATLIPASAVLTLSLAWGAIVSIALLLGTIGSGTSMVANLTRPIASHFDRKFTQALPTEARAVFVTQKTDDPQELLNRARELADAHPNDPLYYANYVGKSLENLIVRTTFRLDATKFTHVLPLLDRGMQIEPDNGFYPLVKAAILFDAAGELIDDGQTPPQSLPGFDYHTRAGTPERWTGWRFHVTDPALFEAALAEIHHAASKPYIDSHSIDLFEKSLASLPPPQTLGEIVWRRWHLAPVSLPGRRFYAVWPALWRATDLAGHGQPKEAMQLVHDCRHIALAIARSSRAVPDLIAARTIFALSLGTRAMVEHQSGDVAAFDRTVAAMLDEQDVMHRLWRQRSDAINARAAQRDVIAIADRDVPMSNLPEHVDFAPGRHAEFAVADRMALSLLLGILTATVAAALLSAVVARIRTGRWPTMAFIGWRKLAGVVFISTLLPVGLYALYTLTPLSGRHRALDSSFERLVIEYLAVACAIVTLLRFLSNRALRQRATELDADELKRRSPGKATLFAGIALVIGVIIHHTLTRNGGLPWRVQWLFPLLVAGLIGYLLMALFGPRHQRGPSQSTLRRLSPALAATSIMGLILAAGWLLFSRRFSRDFEPTIRAATIFIAVTIALTLLARFVGKLRQAETALTFNYRLSTIPPLLFSAIVLALLASWPLKLEERRAVAAMDAGNISRLSNEVEQGRWQELKDRLQSLPE